ncbi:MAG: VWA domain-containing protein [Acidobacteriota bacterium]|nr:VWA domain-containing protein [Acidobacteriota bacterium]
MKQKICKTSFPGEKFISNIISELLAVVILFVLIICPNFFLPEVSAQESGQEKASNNLQYQVQVIRKLVYVIVTDNQGQPVTDLSREDFILYDDGQEKVITEFENHTMSLPAGGQQSELTMVNKPEEKAGIRPPLINRTFLYLFDLVFTDQGGFKLAREAALRSLEKELEPDMLVGVITFTGGQAVNVLHEPNRDREAARRAIESLGAKDIMPLAPSRQSDFRTSAGSYSQRRANLSPGHILARNFIKAMESLARALPYIQGKKVIILYSTGLHPAYLGRGAYVNNGNAYLGRTYEELCRYLANANASVFPVDTEDNFYLKLPDAGKGVASLQEIASKTGGHYSGTIYDAPDHLEKIESLTGAYYVLGYPVEESWDGKYHQIKVKIKRPGCQVIFQPGYFNQKPFASLSDLEKKIQLVDLALASKPLSGEPVRFAMEAQIKAPKPPKNIRLTARVRVDDLGEVAGPRVEVISLIFDRLDQIVDSRRFELDLTRPEYRQVLVSLQSELSARAGNYKCRLVIRNMETGRAAVAATSITIPEIDKN